MNGITYLREVKEAVVAGETAIRSLQAAKEKLDSARNWGILDILSGNKGGLISGFIKHSRVNAAQNCIDQACRFDREHGLPGRGVVPSRRRPQAGRSEKGTGTPQAKAHLPAGGRPVFIRRGGAGVGRVPDDPAQPR